MPERNAVDHAAVDQPPVVVFDDREHSRQCGAREQRRPAVHARTRPLHPCRGRWRSRGRGTARSAKLRAGRGPVDQRVEPRCSKRCVSRRTRFQARLSRLPGNTSAPVREVQTASSCATPVKFGECAYRRAVQRTGRGTDHDVGDDAPLEHRPQHPDLGHALVPATRQHERRARWVGGGAASGSSSVGERSPHGHTEDFGARATRLMGVLLLGHCLQSFGARERPSRPSRFLPAKKGPAYIPRRFLPGRFRASVTEFYRQYLAVAVFVVAAFVMVGAMLGLARLLRTPNPQDEKYITYESGSDPLPLFGQANVRYYIYALLFVIFDVEAVFIFPWAVNVDAARLVRSDRDGRSSSWCCCSGSAYVWRKGLLKWA